MEDNTLVHLGLTKSKVQALCAKLGATAAPVVQSEPAKVLTNEQVRRIRNLEKNGVRRKEIANMFGININTCNGIIQRRTYAHVR